MQHFENILIITKSGSEAADTLGRRIRSWLDTKGHRTEIRENNTGTSAALFRDFNPDLILVLGGDGTMFSVARTVAGKSVPLLGINQGQVGFLTDLSLADWEEGLSDILSGTFTESQNGLLSFCIEPVEGKVSRGLAVNDVVVCRGSLARLIGLRIFYGEEEIGELRADGIIASTPTGATAYSVSAGGPLIHPGPDVITLTPICPFLSGFTPMVLPLDREVVIEVSEGPARPYLTQDGQIGYPLGPGDRVIITLARERLRLIQPIHSSYFRKLKSKGFIRGDNA